MLKTMLRTLAIVVCFVFLISVGFVGCGAGKSTDQGSQSLTSETKETTKVEAKKLRILFVSPMVGHPVWLGAKEGMDAAAAEFGIDAIWTGADDHSVDKTVEALERAIAEKPDGIVCCPFSPSAFTKTLEKAKEAGIPVSCVAVDAENKDIRNAFIGTNNTQWGKIHAEALYKKVGDPFKVGVIMSNLDAANQIEGVNQLKELVKNTPGAEIVDIQADAGDQVKAMELFTAMIKAHPDMNALFGAEGGGAPGFAKVLEEMNLKNKITVISMDDTEQNLAVVREGKIYGVMAQNFFKMGYLGTKYAWEAAQGKEVPSETDSGVTLVTKENIDTYKNDR